MKNIVWTRIDDRLIHGQVMTQWIQQTSADEVLIIDNGVAKDTFIQMVMKSSVPSKIKLTVKSEEEAITYLNDESNGENIIILVKTPLTIVNIIEKGITIESVNVGGIGARAGRKKLYKNISASDEELNAFRVLIDKNVDVFFRVVVTDSKESVGKHI